jgi:RNA recognition motif-containing protein
MRDSIIVLAPPPPPPPLDFSSDLPPTTSSLQEREIEDVFAKYGKLTNVWVARNPPGFAYVEYEDERDAEEAIKSVPGTLVAGVALTVEFAQSSGPKPRGSWRPPYDDRRGGGGYDDRRGGYDDRRGGYDDRRRSPPRGDDRGGGRYDWNPAGSRRSRSRR